MQEKNTRLRILNNESYNVKAMLNKKCCAHTSSHCKINRCFRKIMPKPHKVCRSCSRSLLFNCMFTAGNKPNSKAF